MILFNVTYEKVNEESAAEGDAFDRGFIVHDVRLRDAVYYVCGSTEPQNLSYCEANDSRHESARWFDFAKVNEGTREEIEQGIEESRAIHVPDKVTGASRKRLAKLFQAYGANK
jgi:hypothetical protein